MGACSSLFAKSRHPSLETPWGLPGSNPPKRPRHPVCSLYCNASPRWGIREERAQVKQAKLVIGALVVGALVAVIPELFGPGPRADFGVGQKLATGAILLPLGLIFLGGLLTALTPCVYPLIPITISVFGAKQAQSRGRAIALTLVYILGIALMFTTLGIAAALTGKAFGTVLSNPWVVVGLALLFVLFAASMFGAFDFQLPSGLQTWLGSIGKAGFLGAFLMGLAAGVVAAPCTGPVLSGVLVHVAATQNVPLGAALLFTYALGLGVPFFLIGALSISLPKSGGWMESVKSVFGIALLALAVLYLRDAFPYLRANLTLKPIAYGAVIAAVLVGAGVLAGAVHRTFGSWPLDGLLKGAGILLAVIGLSLRPGAPLAQPRPVPSADWLQSEEAAIAQAQTFKKPVLIDFFAEWCSACKELDHFVYTDDYFLSEAKRWVLVKIDGTEETPALEALYKKYKVDGLPTVILIDSQGKVHQGLTIKGYLPPPQFVDLMKQIQ
ncbi:MAG: thioredoxin family protein [Deltaproteobacteria bacterium]|nr:thioredoxin family protein [Deltaproteobacteria bacterium]